MGERTVIEQNRQFFRIRDRVYFSYRLTPDAPASESPSSPVDANPLLSLPDKLSELTHESRQTFRKLSKESPEAAAAITILDKKINLLTAALVSQSLVNSGQALMDVSLSAAGVGFFSAEPLPKQTLVEVTLFLPPSLYKIVSLGKIAYCRLKEHDPMAGHYQIGVDFFELSERDQEFLSGHVLKKQAEDIKHQRELEADQQT